MASRFTTCIICWQEATQICGQCKLVKYCGTSCQQKDWHDHKLICKQRSELPPRPSDRHFLSLYFPIDQVKPRLMWVLGQPTGSKKAHLDETAVGKLVGDDFDCSGMGCGPGKPGEKVETDKVSAVGEPPLTQPITLHYTTEPYHQKNACLGGWVGGMWLRRIAPGPLLVSGHTSGDIGPDSKFGHRDFEMQDLNVLKTLLTGDFPPHFMKIMMSQETSPTTRGKKSWFRM
ncbi:hypothetical protein B0A48_11913 [Cryoendolithus antarcticus]|uniref:MYND-type domain-containing protein n=1 Tax=Cryoendolithus antarcticus TaxID=1507870 RepID=A0A1V8STH0_9PEZI|nr:hypothetical protein B0A48_11913 [Cryoendolithus antarcticus]